MKTRIKCSEDGHELEYTYIFDDDVKWLIVAPCPDCKAYTDTLEERINKLNGIVDDYKFSCDEA